MRVREHLVQAFVAEGVDAVFGLMGDANMAWMASMAAQPGMRIVHARYEGAAIAMADGYARAAGTVGVASVTCGPGLTQVVTSLTAAVRRGACLVVLTGDTPQSAAYHLQAVDQGPVIRAAGALYQRVEAVSQVRDAVARAFATTRQHRCPVVLSVPYDLQEQELPDLQPGPTSAAFDVAACPPLPDPRDVTAMADLLSSARSPVLLAGAGAVRAGCRSAVQALATRFGAHTATTLLAKGWFDAAPGDLGVAGGFSSDATRAVFAEADLVVALGARLAHHTTDGGTLFPAATVVQVDLAPTGRVDGRRAADRYVRADVAALVTAVLEATAGRAARPPLEPQRVPAPAGPATTLLDGVEVLDPSHVMRAVDEAVPRDVPVVVGVGHFWNFVVPALSGREPSRYHFTYDFGVIGQALPTGMGVAVAEASPTVVIEGDGSLLMNVQELESLGRHGLPVLVLVLNDGAYGAEYHKLPQTGAPAELAVFGWTPLDRVATAFGLRGRRPTCLAELAAGVAEFVADPVPTLLDVHLDYRVLSPQFARRIVPAP